MHLIAVLRYTLDTQVPRPRPPKSLSNKRFKVCLTLPYLPAGLIRADSWRSAMPSLPGRRPRLRWAGHSLSLGNGLGQFHFCRGVFGVVNDQRAVGDQ